jgi:hypothetical protein
MSNLTFQHPYTLPLTPEAFLKAEEFAKQQDTLEKANQIYENTLVIYGVRDYLEEIGYPIDLTQSYSFNVMYRTFKNVADVYISNLGYYLECYPIKADQTEIELTEEKLDRIAHLAVKIEPELKEIQFLGFYRSNLLKTNQEIIKLEELEDIENLIDYLFSLEIARDKITEDPEIVNLVNTRLNNSSLGEIVLELNKIYYQCSNKRQLPYQGAILFYSLSQNKSLELVKANPDDLDLNELKQWQELAKKMFTKLAEIW